VKVGVDSYLSEANPPMTHTYIHSTGCI